MTQHESNSKKEEVYRRIKISKLLNKARYYRNIACDDEKAIETCNKILAIENNHRDALLIKAGALDTLGDDAAALDIIMTITEKWPDYWEAYYLFGLHMFNKNEKEAMKSFKKSLELKETFDNLISTAQLAFFMKQYDFYKFLDKAARLDPQRFRNYMKNYWAWD